MSTLMAEASFTGTVAFLRAATGRPRILYASHAFHPHGPSMPDQRQPGME